MVELGKSGTGRILAILLVLSTLGIGCAGERGSTSVEPEGRRATSDAAADFAAERKAMVAKQIARRGIKDAGTLRALATVPRHEFVPHDQVDHAYEDRPLPIGFGQTISQPYIVALMTELLDVQDGDRVLEVGTGSGYQAAILAELTDRVYTIEIVPELAEKAAETLDRLGYSKITAKTADGYYGWEERAPFDAIIVTAAPDHVPPPLIRQLKEGGRLVIPVGPPGSYQTLWRMTKKHGRITSTNITGVLFVPLMRDRD